MTEEQMPLYVKIYEKLKEMIEKGMLSEGDQLPTEHELAKEYNVSRITSKRALAELERENLIIRKRGSGSFVKKVERPKPDNVTQEKNMIAMILPFHRSAEMMDYIHGATNALTEKNMHLTILSSDSSFSKEQQLLETVPKQGVAGIILYPQREHYDLGPLYDLYLSDYPIVAIDKYFMSLPIPSVVSDNVQGGMDATEHLIACGHRKISFVAGVELAHTVSVRDRFLGYAETLKKHSIGFDSSLCRIGMAKQWEEKNGMDEMIADLLDSGITAILCENDILATKIIRQAERMHIEVPETLAVVGFDGINTSHYLDKTITTIAQD
ncbi:MAG: GntR family transcriptional regulator, partial [Bacilli bacterium]